jgi:SAM-dependent methyltransferase
VGKPPVLTTVSGADDIRAFFDALAPVFGDPHGPPQKLLRHRLALIKKHCGADDRDDVLEIGCGRGDHLLAFLGPQQRGFGIDLSPAMVREARARLRFHPAGKRAVFFEGDAADLSRLESSSIGLAFAVGAFEHMLDKPAALKSVFRVLKPGGRFVCLSPNGEFLWYSRLAPRLGINTRHLSSDAFLSRSEFVGLLREAGFTELRVAFWRFIPAGDVPPGWALVLGVMDLAGRLLLPSKLRGGILVRAVKGS